MRPSYLRVVPSRPRLVPLTAELFAMAMLASEDWGHTDQGQRPEVLRLVLAPGLSYAVIDGGTIALAYGLVPVVFGRAQGWMTRTRIARPRHLTFATREAREHIDQWNREERFRRIEIHIQDGQPWRHTFARRLGMNECHGPVRKWDAQGRDYWLYARVAP